MKKLVSVGALVLVILMGVVMSGCGKEYSESDFSLEISVDKTTATIGSIVEVTVEFKNLSGNDLMVHINTSCEIVQKDIIQIAFFPNGTDYGFDIQSIHLNNPRLVKIKKGAIIQIVQQFQIENEIDYIVAAGAVFYIGNGYNNGIQITTEQLEISIEEEV